MNKYQTPEQYLRARAALHREQGAAWVADFLDRLADNCAALAAEHQAVADDYIPF